MRLQFVNENRATNEPAKYDTRNSEIAICKRYRRFLHRQLLTVEFRCTKTAAENL